MLARLTRFALAGLAVIAIATASLYPAIAQGPTGAPTGSTPEALSPPAAPVESAKDFATVSRGSLVREVFVVRNDGKSALELSSLDFPCQCGTIRLPPSIAAGGTGEIGVEIDTVDMAGPVKIDFSVASNEPDAPRRAFRLTGIVKPVVFAKPGYARFQYVQGEPDGKIKQRLWADDFPGLEIVAVRTPQHPFLANSFRELAVEEKPAGAKGRQWEVVVGVGAGAEVGPLIGRIEIETNHPIDRLVRLPLSGFVRPVLAVTPPVAKLVAPVSSEHGSVAGRRCAQLRHRGDRTHLGQFEAT